MMCVKQAGRLLAWVAAVSSADQAQVASEGQGGGVALPPEPLDSGRTSADTDLRGGPVSYDSAYALCWPRSVREKV